MHPNADIWGSFAVVWGSFADVWGPFAEIWGSFAEIWGSFADVWGSGHSCAKEPLYIYGCFRIRHTTYTHMRHSTHIHMRHSSKVSVGAIDTLHPIRIVVTQ